MGHRTGGCYTEIQKITKKNGFRKWLDSGPGGSAGLAWMGRPCPQTAVGLRVGTEFPGKAALPCQTPSRGHEPRGFTPLSKVLALGGISGRVKIPIRYWASVWGLTGLPGVRALGEAG